VDRVLEVREQRSAKRGDSGYPRNLPGLLTETQAQTYKTCPQTLVGDEPGKCLGSRCGAWVWELWPSNFGKAPDDPVGRCGLVPSGMPLPISGEGVVLVVETDFMDFENSTRNLRARQQRKTK
jgi:hypothetical protein